MNFSKIRKPVFASVAAAFLVVGGSAFKPALVDNYGKDASGNWISLAGLTPVSPTTQPEQGEYRCIDSQNECTAEFSYPNPAPNADDYQSVSRGTFDLGQ
ncbi:hypothetical protein [Pedobacter agri]|uniref:hypothetical protein n=1 Tax=Pedobacter agri TaxID=454586 RepID=UPI00292CA93F|nr:hypothetical protein [Pedobacter agri]